MSFFDQLDPATTLLWAIDDSESAMRSSIAMSMMEKYLSAAYQQVKRITEELAWVEQQATQRNPNWTTFQNQAFVDMHFYFTCWDAIGKMMRTIARRSGLESARRVYDKHRQSMERYRNARHHLEHFDERLPGGKKVDELKVPGDLGNLAGTTYSFGGETWDIGPDSLKALSEIIGEFQREVHKESVEILEAKRDAESQP